MAKIKSPITALERSQRNDLESIGNFKSAMKSLGETAINAVSIVSGYNRDLSSPYPDEGRRNSQN